MTAPRVPRTPSALPLDDSPHDLNQNRNHTLGYRSHPSVVTPDSVSRSFDASPMIVTNSPSFNNAPPVPQSLPFRTTTIAPSPPTRPNEQFSPYSNNGHFDILSSSPQRDVYSPSSLRLSIDSAGSPSTSTRRESFNNSNNVTSRPSMSLAHRTSASSLRPVSRTPSLKAALTNSFGSGTSSGYPSPIISAMGDVTPLPSPLMSGDSPGPWRKLNAGSVSPIQSRQRITGQDSVLVTASGESIDSALTHGPKRKIYSSLEPGERIPGPNALGSNARSQPHTRNRSASEYVPDPMGIPKRQATVTGGHSQKKDPSIEAHLEPHMRRELNYAESRGLTPTVTKPPTPPPSESSRDSADGSSKPKGPRSEFFEAFGRRDGKKRRWRSLKMLGQGTFSRVMLATSQIEPEEAPLEAQAGSPENVDRKTLVAVKVCEHGPRGGASEERVEMSLKRELEIMQTIHHPSLVDLKAWSIEPTRAILVLSHCAGGDLFDVATTHRAVLQPALLRRIFAELVGAVSYLHERRIVHRDVKLENVLVNLTATELADTSIDWATYPYSVTTLTDLGLSRRITDDEKLETRCGSDDYAAPEVIMGQPYDGRATDAWSLGVLLYALLEARLPFDPHPGMSDAHRMRSRTSHRIARVEWRWVDFAGDDTDHDGSEAKFKEKGLEGALEITEGLLKRARGRWGVDKVAKTKWVQDAIRVEGGIRFREEKDGEEVV